jgi:hypothetical protein
MIPDKNLFIVTSALKPAIGAFNDQDRFNQTVATLKSLRLNVPYVKIVFVDCSIREVPQMERDIIGQYVNLYMDMSQEPNMKHLSEIGAKSHAELVMLFNTLAAVKHDPQLHGILDDVKRIFKFSARSELEDTFDILQYENMFGKFVFKKRIPSWMNPAPVSDLFITRMFSLCPSLIDTYLNVIKQNLASCDAGLDTEHAHFQNIPKEYLVEFDKLHFWGWLAGNGQIEHY